MGFGPTGERAWPVEAHMQRAPCCRVQAKSQIAEVLSNHCRLQHSPNFHCAGFLRELRGVSLRPVRFKVLTCCRQVNILNRRVRQEAPQRMQRPTKLKRCTLTIAARSPTLSPTSGGRVNRKKMPHASLILLVASWLISTFSQGMRPQNAPPAIGVFEAHTDVGTVLHPGSLQYDASAQTYVVTGSGENMWFATDAFHFVWKKMSGDVSLTADVSFANGGGNEHKKAVLIIRQSLDEDSTYADVALHASGLTSLQYRDAKGAATREIQAYVSAPARLGIVKRGQIVYISLAGPGGELKPAGASVRLPFSGTFYVGIGVCAHDKDAVVKATFSRVELTTP